MDAVLTEHFSQVKNLSWENSSRSVYLMQKRLYKSVYVGNLPLAFALQKLILKASSSRLVSIRYVVQLCPTRKIPGIDGKVALSFSDRFELNESLKNNYNSWRHESLKKISILNKDNSLKYLKLSTISDRAWQHLLKLALEPAHEALFHPTNFVYRVNSTPYAIQNFICSNLGSESLGFQKRLLEVDLSFTLCNFYINYLLKKLIVPRSIKVCLNNLLRIGFDIKFSDFFPEGLDLSSLLANILLTGVEDIHFCFRFGSKVIFFLKPFDNEAEIFSKLNSFLLALSSKFPKFPSKLISSQQGFDFWGWNFKASYRECLVVPSQTNYRQFLFRIKRVINNSNYGAEVKATKLFPVVKDWLLYHRFSSLKGPRFSLFFIKKRAFKAFSKESRQDFYSSKRLLNKCFYMGGLNLNVFLSPGSFSSCYGHVSFCFSFRKEDLVGSNENKNFFCIHCGVNYSFPRI